MCGMESKSGRGSTEGSVIGGWQVAKWLRSEFKEGSTIDLAK